MKITSGFVIHAANLFSKCNCSPGSKETGNDISDIHYRCKRLEMIIPPINLNEVFWHSGLFTMQLRGAKVQMQEDCVTILANFKTLSLS